MSVADKAKGAAKAAAPKAPARKSAPKGEAKEKGAPRARKYNYGISPEAKIKLIKTEEQIGTLRGDLTGDYTAIADAKTVAEYTEKGGTRHGLRVFMRREILQLEHEGQTYPQAYVKPEPKAAAGE